MKKTKNQNMWEEVDDKVHNMYYDLLHKLGGNESNGDVLQKLYELEEKKNRGTKSFDENCNRIINVLNEMRFNDSETVMLSLLLLALSSLKFEMMTDGKQKLKNIWCNANWEKIGKI